MTSELTCASLIYRGQTVAGQSRLSSPPVRPQWKLQNTSARKITNLILCAFPIADKGLERYRDKTT